MGAVSSKRIASETGELEKRASTNLLLATSNSNLQAAFPVTREKKMSVLPHLKSRLDVKQEKNSCIVPEEEPSNLLQKQNSETRNRTSFLDKASPAAEQEQYKLHQKQSSGVTHVFRETRGEESIWPCKTENEKDSDMLKQIPNSNPVIPLQSDPPLVSHVMVEFSKISKDQPADLHLSQNADFGVKTSSICDGERTTKKREMVADTSLPMQSVNGVPGSQSNEQMLIQSSQPGKVLEKLQPRRNPDAGGCSSQIDQVIIRSGHSEKNSVVPKEEPQPDNSQARQRIHAINHALQSKEEKVTDTKGQLVSQNLVQASSLSIGVAVPQPGQDSYSYATKFEKVEKLQPRRNLDPVVQESQSDAGSTPSKVSDKGLDDGYNWRKYGQKLVKGNKFVRSYYKCTYPSCQAKKQVERSHDGCKSDINYLGVHHHQKPQQSPQVTTTFQVRTPEMPIASTSRTNAELITKDAGSDQHMAPTEASPQSTVGRSADGLSVAVSCSNNETKDLDDCPDPKRQKRDVCSADDDAVNRSNSDSRHVVQTLSEVDLVNDGYRWRKYGQKLVKGNPNPRSYYRCSNAGCPVKKHVERASHDPKLVITTYEGKHDHDIPTSRTVSQSTARGDSNMMSPNGDSSSKREDNSPVSLEMAVHVSAN
ncbi:hypothetical protein C2S51_003624 [Perilla frutescens var. frutescens]|nr:hypothetical protein C2S51_003624 [Perilla frutescens var. frutescens]